MLRCVAVALCSLVLTTSAMAQVIYEPIRYEFETPRGEKYYYGGVDPRVHAVAAHSGVCRGYSYATNLHNFDGGNTFNQPSPMYDRPAVFTDCVPFRDASRFGYTPADARNEAYANSPTYFRKADLLANAIVAPDGTRIVPASSPRLLVTPAPMYVPMRPNRGQIIIIPKRLLDRPLKDFEKKAPSVASVTP